MKRWSLRLLLSAGCLCLLLGAAEAVLAVTGLVADPQAFTMRRATGSLRTDMAGRYAADEARWFTTAEGFRATPSHLSRDATAEWPFRGRPGAPSPPAVSLPRVLVVGDSCVYGAGLDACDTLGWRLQQELAARGLPPQRVAVVPLGVPGYSTEQLRPLLDEGLRTLRPVAVVLYVAAWNDQAPALRASDRVLLAELSDPGPLAWLRRHTRLGAALLALGDPSQAEILAGWRAGAPPRGPRVPEADVGPNVAAMIAACEAADALPVLIAPPHPPATRRDHPRTLADARAVLRAAAEARVPCLDGQSLLEAAGGDVARHFQDDVHPAPEAVALLAAAAAEPVARVLHATLAEREDGCAADPLRVLDVQPQEAFALGDLPVRLRLENWSDRSPLPAVLVGGAPLVGLHAVAADQVEGLLPANAPGRHDILVQDEFGVSVAPAAIELLDAQIELLPGPPPELRVRARPRDRLCVLAATSLRATPRWTARGAERLGDDARTVAGDLALDGRGEAHLPDLTLPPGRAVLQALWAPAGEDPRSSPLARWTGVVEAGG